MQRAGAAAAAAAKQALLRHEADQVVLPRKQHVGARLLIGKRLVGHLRVRGKQRHVICVLHAHNATAL